MAAKFNIVKKGYNPEEVDSYIQGLESALKGYKEKEVAIKNALINAQLASDNIIKAAEEESASLKSDTLYQLETIRNTILEQKQVLSGFQVDYNNLIRKYLHDVSTNEFDILYSKIDSLANNLDSLFSTENIRRSESTSPTVALGNHGGTYTDFAATKVFQVPDEVRATPDASAAATPLVQAPPVLTPQPMGAPLKPQELSPEEIKPIAFEITKEEDQALRDLFK